MSKIPRRFNDTPPLACVVRCVPLCAGPSRTDVNQHGLFCFVVDDIHIWQVRCHVPRDVRAAACAAARLRQWKVHAVRFRVYRSGRPG